jgi:hypothetical protein
MVAGVSVIVAQDKIIAFRCQRGTAVLLSIGDLQATCASLRDAK